ncbi:MAG: hypothetical protein K2M22_10825 [Lachnospiraceae bacterium]|nr:hypothetical protein [Lachnospiraceae bacterium]MDE7176338.1 hypothetical protein [Lachnospiraceae bacterium]
MRKGKKSLLDIITEHSVNERLDAILFCDPVFRDLQNKIEEQMEVFNKLGFSKKARLVVDRLISAYTESAAYHSAVAYRFGLKDCAAMLCEIGLVKAIESGGTA